nr:Gfo/Idh/MocA family oxidoreductase [Tessaracoccus coleopterorum]
MDAGLFVLCEKPSRPPSRRRQRWRNGTRPSNGPCHRRIHAPLRPRLRGAAPSTRPGNRRARPDDALGAPKRRGVPGKPSSATITNSAVHEIDILPWLTRTPIVEVQWTAGRTTSLLGERHDPQLLLLRDAEGVLHTVSVQVHAQYGYDVRCELICERGSVELPNVPGLVDDAPLIVNADLSRSSAYPADWRPRFETAYRRELTAWVTASLAGTVPAEAATIEESLRTTRIAHALVRSMNDGGWVSVPSRSYHAHRPPDRLPRSPPVRADARCGRRGRRHRPRVRHRRLVGGPAP